MSKDLDWHLNIGKDIADLRRKGVLILGSGNVVHNLRTMRWGGKPYDWAEEFDTFFANKLEARDLAALADRQGMGNLFRMAQPTPTIICPP